jgi:hypothetical protein
MDSDNSHNSFHPEIQELYATQSIKQNTTGSKLLKEERIKKSDSRMVQKICSGKGI